MLNGERWLAHGDTCMLTVVPCEGGLHACRALRTAGAPFSNLPNMAAVLPVPFLWLVRGHGGERGSRYTQPFQCIGYPATRREAPLTPGAEVRGRPPTKAGNAVD